MDRIVAAPLLGLALAGIALFLRRDRGDWARFKALAGTGARQSYYRRWASRLWGCFAVPAFVALAMLGRTGALLDLPPELRGVARLVPAIGDRAGPLLVGMGAGVVIGLIVVMVVTRLRGRRAPRVVGDIAAMLPRNRAELALCAWLSVSAGISEELAFRLTLPLLLAIVTGSAMLAVLVAIALFGAMHFYQGWAGVAATTAIGAALMVCYLASGALWLAIALHIVIDLSGLVLRPMLAGAWRR